VNTQPPQSPRGHAAEQTRGSLDGTGRARPRRGPPGPPGLRCRIRLHDGRVFCGELGPERHRALHLGLLHADSDGLVDSRRVPGRPAARSRSTAAPGASTSCPAAPPEGPDGSTCSWSTPGGSSPASSPARGSTASRARRRSSVSRRARGRAAARTPSRTPGGSGSTSTVPSSCPPCGRSSPSGRVTC
jgi:hypothetical protein